MKVTTPEAKLAKLAKLLEDLGFTLQAVYDELTDEGDRVYLGSTNHKETIRDALDKFDEWWYREGPSKP